MHYCVCNAMGNGFNIKNVNYFHISVAMCMRIALEKSINHSGYSGSYQDWFREIIHSF
jgi:hypothetical protein